MNKEVKKLIAISKESAKAASWSATTAPKASLKQMALHFDEMLNGIVAVDAEAVNSAEFAKILPYVNMVRRNAGLTEVKVSDYKPVTDGAKV